jgi:hypothetical protein
VVIPFVTTFDDGPFRFKTFIDTQGYRDGNDSISLRLRQRSDIRETAFILSESALLKEIPDAWVVFIPIGERNLNNNILIDVLIEKVRVVESKGRTGRKRIIQGCEDCGFAGVSRVL